MDGWAAANTVDDDKSLTKEEEDELFKWVTDGHVH